uniref:Coat protein n=1 Tax=White campion partitivirus TaxID=2933100 RepID=A0A9C7GWP2_9VIRU|nr:putative coat protein [White campion partitivirus]CAI5383992.1 putative coat protein [White campion partitivirus]
MLPTLTLLLAAPPTMDQNIPQANPSGHPVPNSAATETRPHNIVNASSSSSSAAPQPPAQSSRRNRNPRSPVPHTSSSSTSGAPALLELSVAYPLQTNQRRSPNTFAPDAQMLFYALGICDNMMVTTDRFIHSSPAWLPIVSQLYISVLWLTMILKVYVDSGYGALHAQLHDDLIKHLRIDECLIPGPLVPFFQSLSAINGPFEWVGDILPAFPNFSQLWDATNFAPKNNFARIFPIPAVMLDQLYYFATWTPGANQSVYGHFEWYRNIFSVGQGTYNRHHRVAPQHCGSTYASLAQIDAARSFWNPIMTGNFTRINSAAGNTALSHHMQLFGFFSQNGIAQTDWFQHAATIMQKYCQFFNGSVPLKSIKTIGLGSVAVHGKARYNTSVRNWIYPTTSGTFGFRCNRFTAVRDIPDNLAVSFVHSDHELEEQAEQYAILSHTNIYWSANYTTQNNWTQLTEADVRSGEYWTMLTHRSCEKVQLKGQVAQIIASRYHQQYANLTG